jgi:hypothetical protein
MQIIPSVEAVFQQPTCGNRRGGCRARAVWNDRCDAKRVPGAWAAGTVRRMGERADDFRLLG